MIIKNTHKLSQDPCILIESIALSLFVLKNHFQCPCPLKVLVPFSSQATYQYASLMSSLNLMHSPVNAFHLNILLGNDLF